MSFKLTADDAGRSRIVVAGDCDYVIPLPIAPLHLEDYLKQGQWLVISMSVWSVHDIRAGHRAIEVLRRSKGLVNLGLRPFDHADENSTWIPGIRPQVSSDLVEIRVGDQGRFREVTIKGAANASPVWVAFSNAKLVNLKFGQLSDAEIEDLVSQLKSM